MPNQSKPAVFALTIGCLLIVGGALLLVGKQLEITSIATGVAIFAILLGIIVVITGKKLKTPSSSTEQLGIVKPATPVQTAAKTPVPFQPAAQEISSNVDRLRKKLLGKCLNDEARVDRLIQLERNLSPNANEEWLYERAIERLERDLR